MYLNLHLYLAGFSVLVITSYYTHKILNTSVLAIEGQTQDPPPHNVLSSTNTPVFRNSACTFPPTFLFIPLLSQGPPSRRIPHQAPLSIVASWHWTASLHGQGHCKEEEAGKGGRILAAGGSPLILIMSSLQGQHLWVACTHSSNSFMEQQTLLGVLCSVSPS